MKTSLIEKIVNATLLLGPILGALVAAAAVRAAEPVPTLRIAAIDANASEAGHRAVFMVTRDAAVTQPLVVPIKLSGTATPGADYVSPGSSITFPAQVQMVTVEIAPVADALVEGTESVIVALAPNPGAYSLDEQSSATATITDASGSAAGSAGKPGKGVPPLPPEPPAHSDPPELSKLSGSLSVELTLDGQGTWRHASNGAYSQMKFHRVLSYTMPLEGYVGAGSGFTNIDRREGHPLTTLPNFQRYLVLQPRGVMTRPAGAACGKGESQILDEYKGMEEGDPGQPRLIPYIETWKGGGPFPSGDRTLSERDLCMTRIAVDTERHVMHVLIDGSDSDVKTRIVHNGFEARPVNVKLQGHDPDGSAKDKLTFFDVPVPAGAKSFELSRVIENFSEVTGKGYTKVPMRATIKWRVTVQ